MKFKQFGKLPGKPSELLKIAMADLAKVERSEKYIVNMREWFRYQKDGTCTVCLAGSVMVKTLKESPDNLAYIVELPEKEADALEALNAFRQGHVALGLLYLRIYNAPLPREIDIIEYEDNPRQFRKEMRSLINDLEKAGY